MGQDDRKPGRNDPCWCGSGKKYKRCHLDSDREERRAQATHLRVIEGGGAPKTSDVESPESNEAASARAIFESLPPRIQQVLTDKVKNWTEADLETFLADEAWEEELEQWDDALGEIRYDAAIDPDPELWLEADESERIDWVERYHQTARPHPEAENPRLHATVHMIVENQAAMGEEMPVRATLERLQSEGLTRHDAIHAIGSLLSERLWQLMHGKDKWEPEAYNAELAELTAESWRKMFDDEQ